MIKKTVYNTLLFTVLSFLLLPASRATVVRMDIAFGNESTDVIYIDLFETAAPVTVTNFLRYVDDAGDRRYDGTFIHRSMPGFVLQGGGYTFTTGQGPVAVQAYAPIVNEFDISRSNTRGTIAMAKLPTGPDTATSEWFFNLADNNDPNNPNSLDNQNGGFTVFGTVIGNGMQVVDRIAALQTASLPLTFGGSPSPVPFTSFNGGLIDNTNLVQVSSINVYPVPAAATVSPSETGQLDFGDTEIGLSRDLDIAVANLGVAALNFTLAFTGQDAASFSTTNQCSDVQFGETCTETLTVSPVSRGALTAQLEITSNDPNSPVVSIPVSAYVSGDNDGIPDNIESAGPNNGDANHDGIADTLQDHVTSFPNLNGDYVTLETSPGMNLTSVRAAQNPSPFDTPVAGGAELTFSEGFFGFNIENVPVGGSATVTMTLSSGQPTNYFKFGLRPGDDPLRAPYWYRFDYNGAIGAQFDGNRVILHFVDGGIGDNDRTANGVIVDPGGPATLSTSTSSSSSSGGGGGGCSALPVASAGQPRQPIELLLLLLGLGIFRVFRGEPLPVHKSKPYF